MYVQGFLLAVPADKKDAYVAMAKQGWDYFQSLGATEMVEAWEADVSDGKVTDFRMATKAEPGEKIVFSWIVWPDRKTCDEAAKKMMESEEMANMGEMPFDGMRMMWGGFDPVFSAGRD